MTIKIDWLNLEWTSFGLGFMYVNVAGYRYHVWHSSLNTVNAIDIHTHPWDFTSEIISGYFRNRIYKRVEGDEYHERFANCDTATCAISETKTNLTLVTDSYHYSGGKYTLTQDQIHCATARDGTVTRIRKFNNKPECSAHFFWQEGSEFCVADKSKILDLTQHPELESIVKNILQV